MSDIGAIILAAGASTRLGRPKQLLRFGSETLVSLAAKAALAHRSKVVVVIGASSDLVRRALDSLPVLIAENSEWQSGMAGSIKTGVSALISQHHIDALLLITCDQPLISSASIARLLLAREKTWKPVIASAYSGITGVPALFDRTYFPALLALNGVQGAQHIIRSRPEDVAEVSMPEAAFDIDTESDLRRAMQLVAETTNFPNQASESGSPPFVY